MCRALLSARSENRAAGCGFRRADAHCHNAAHNTRDEVGFPQILFLPFCRYAAAPFATRKRRSLPRSAGPFGPRVFPSRWAFQATSRLNQSVGFYREKTVCATVWQAMIRIALSILTLATN